MYDVSPWAIAIFTSFVAFVLWISFYFARRTRNAAGYFAAGGQIHWSVNGVAFAGDYLSAASFLGICGMIAAYGYDGFLYSIGYLAGWVVALFVVAEPMKRLGKFTFTDALDSKFNSKGIQLAAAVSTLVVSLCYLIPQMVGAGTLVTPLLGLPHWLGVVMVGAIVIVIVATAGMASTTYVQFLKGGLLLVFSIALVIVTLFSGLSTTPAPSEGGSYQGLAVMDVEVAEDGGVTVPADSGYETADLEAQQAEGQTFYALMKDGTRSWWQLQTSEDGLHTLQQTHWRTKLASELEDSEGREYDTLLDGKPITESKPLQDGRVSALLKDGKPVDEVRNLGLISYLSALSDSTIATFRKADIKLASGEKVSIFYQKLIPGREFLAPGLKFKVDTAKGATWVDKMEFVSLMLALFLGTAALPHILIRYYTVPTPSAARKSTIVAIAAIGLFYMLTLFMGLGAAVNGVVDLSDNNMSAPLLAKSFGVTLFAIISAIAFATVLGTVSGLIVAASGAVAHDIMDRFFNMKLGDTAKVAAGKVTAIVVGCIAMALGIAFKGMNVGYLVGWAFAVAASANLPAIVMLLFWKRTTKKGIVASVMVGILTSVGLILLSPDMFDRYGLTRDAAPFGLNNPGIVSIPLSFLTLVVVSLFTSKGTAAALQQRAAARLEPVEAVSAGD
jgi:cation/acetate symporter